MPLGGVVRGVDLQGLEGFVKVFVLAMAPVLETRASIPYGLMVGLPIIDVLAISLIGNLLPAPFLLWGLSRLEKWALGDDGWWLKHVAASIYVRLLFKVRKRGEKYINRYGLLGLALFVAVPLPGSGVWTGSLLAHVLGLRPESSFVAIAVGAVIAALLILGGALGALALI